MKITIETTPEFMELLKAEEASKPTFSRSEVVRGGFALGCWKMRQIERADEALPNPTPRMKDALR